jgi:hypothetical protein
MVTKYFRLFKKKGNEFLALMDQEKEETKEAFMMIVNSYKNDVDLTDEEKEAIGEQMKDVLKTIGIVGVTLLPGGSIFLIITNFLKLNKYVLPSSFQKDEKENKKEEK